MPMSVESCNNTIPPNLPWEALSFFFRGTFFYNKTNGFLQKVTSESNQISVIWRILYKWNAFKLFPNVAHNDSENIARNSSRKDILR